MEPQIGIEQQHLITSSQILSKLLADEFLIYTKTLNAHWNCLGADFYSVHLLFENQYKTLADLLDEIAERIRSLGRPAPGSLKQFLALSQLSEEENTDQLDNIQILIKSLLHDHEAISNHIKQQINYLNDEIVDPVTGDLLTSLAKFHEKTAWMLRAHLS